MLVTLQANNTVTFNYTFFHQDGITPFDLSAYDTVTLLLSEPYPTLIPHALAAAFVSKPLGTVTYASYQILVPGDRWHAQFACSVGALAPNNPSVLYGVKLILPTVQANVG